MKDIVNDSQAYIHYIIYRKSAPSHILFDKGKYERSSKGEIIPIPTSKTEGFALWSGYEHTKNLRFKTLKDSQCIKDCKIKRK